MTLARMRSVLDINLYKEGKSLITPFLLRANFLVINFV